MNSPAERVSVSRRVAAEAAKVFDLVTDPDMHVAIDGSGMLLASPDSVPVRAVGDSFVMDMDREPLGDIPMGKYQVLNTITRYEQNHVLEWTVGMLGRSALGHVYGYVLTPAGDDATDVELYCNWSNFHPKLKTQVTWPVVPAHMLQYSLDNLAALATR